ncbi:hypothetical protein Tco_1199445 [Tanacetum coccineum]
MYTFSPMMVANSRKHHCRVRPYTREVLVLSTNLESQTKHYSPVTILSSETVEDMKQESRKLGLQPTTLDFCSAISFIIAGNASLASVVQ